jgi:hypothetical protein
MMSETTQAAAWIGDSRSGKVWQLVTYNET